MSLSIGKSRRHRLLLLALSMALLLFFAASSRSTTAAPAGKTAPCGGWLILDSIVAGQIDNPGAYCGYLFTATRGARFSAAVESLRRFDAELALFDPQGVELISDVMRIDGLRLPSTGTYLLAVRSRSGGLSGLFRMVATIAGNKFRPPVIDKETNVCDLALPPSQPTRGFFDENRTACGFSFTVTNEDVLRMVPDTVVITMTAVTQGLDPLLILYDPEGNEILRSDDIGEGVTDAQLVFQLTQPGVYNFLALSASPELGEFVLGFARRSASAVLICGGTIAFESTRSDDIDTTSRTCPFIFNAERAGRYRVDLTSLDTGFRPQLTIINPAGGSVITPLVVNPNTTGRTATITVATTGRHELRISAFNRASIGDFKVLLDCRSTLVSACVP